MKKIILSFLFLMFGTIASATTYKVNTADYGLITFTDFSGKIWGMAVDVDDITSIEKNKDKLKGSYRLLFMNNLVVVCFKD